MSEWFYNLIKETIKEMESEQKPEGWFSAASVSAIPYIQYPGFTNQECQEVWEQSKEVLRKSRINNNYKETAITYSMNDHSEDKYRIAYGDLSSVPFVVDEKTQKLLQNADEANEMVVISLHNHANTSIFSLNDLLVFAEHPGIRLMEVINKDGEVAFLLRPQPVRYHQVLRDIIDADPEFLKKFDKLSKSPLKNKNFSVTSIITDRNVRMDTTRFALDDLQKAGVCYSGYINNKTKKRLDFSTYIQHMNTPAVQEEFPEWRETNPSLESDPFYEESGEDDYPL
jgi:hypothetical protein